MLSQEKENNITSAYIHIPFCKKICSYCDFCKVFYNDDLVSKYLDKLKEEIDNLYQNEVLSTLYIGGGTPSSLSEKNLDKLFDIIKIFNLNKDYEFTFECNINDINESLLKKLKQNKVNRLSIGIESFNKDKLKILERNNIKPKEKVLLAKKYFNNINIDLIYGINNETIKILKEDLNNFIQLDVPHISIYSLILENNTKLKIKGYKEIDEDLNSDMYNLICKTLKENGYIHYEISNFSKKGYESKHNLTYWNNEKYYGFGAGASGYIKNIRYQNTKSITNYIKGNIIYEKDKITKKIDMENFMILGLRKIKGINEKEFKERYNKDIKEVFNIEKLEYKKGYYYIPYDKLFISNQILVDFIN